MAQQWHYSYCGLQVASELQIPEWDAFEQSRSSEVDVVISLDSKATPNAWGQDAVTANEYRFHVPQIGGYAVRDGREIIVAPAPEAEWRQVRPYLLGSAWGALCYQRGLLVLHASAMRVGNQAVAFCAPIGMGKSSLAAWLCARGYTLVADDLTRFDIPDDSPPTIYPSATRLKLWGDALDALGWNNDDLERDFFRTEKFHVPQSGNELRQPVPLRAIYLLEWNENHSVIRLSGRVALRRFLASATFRGSLIEQMGKTSAYSRQCLELVRRVPVWELKRPCDLSAIDQTVDLLIEHWANVSG